MTSFLQRLCQKVLGTPPEPSPAPSSPDRRRHHDLAATPAGEAGDEVNALSALVTVGARRPLIASDGAIAGFEFCIDQDILKRLRRRDDLRGRAAYVTAVLTSAHLMAQTGRIGFARVPTDWLLQTTNPECAKGAWVGIESSAPDKQAPEQLQALTQLVPHLRAAGAKVGWGVTLALDMTPDFLLLHQGTQPMPALLEAVQNWPAALQGLPTLLTDVARIEDLELALSNGIRYACGALVPAAFTVPEKAMLPISPEVQRVGHLLNQLVTGTDTALIVNDIKSDVGLSYRLLRRIQSASYAQLHADASIDQAVLMLGRNELYRWLSLLLVLFAGKRKTSSAWREITLWRSRLLELLAIENKEPAPSQMFTLGMASMLGPLLKISLPDVISTLHLPAPARQALLEQSGPWHVYLQLALQMEAQSLQEDSELADPFGGVARVRALADEAWAWAWAAEHANREGM